MDSGFAAAYHCRLTVDAPTQRRGDLMFLSRRTWLQLTAGGLLAPSVTPSFAASARKQSPLAITGLKVTPVALPDAPLLAASGCHGPYFLRNIVQLQTDAGVTGV